MNYIFEWDAEKSKLNQKKHGISFEEAKTVFNDPLAVTIFDPDHSVEEDRYLDIGLSAKGNLLVVSYTERNNNIRLISSRKAALQEIRAYEKK